MIPGSSLYDQAILWGKFPDLVGGNNIKGRVQSETENTDLQILLEYPFVL